MSNDAIYWNILNPLHLQVFVNDSLSISPKDICLTVYIGKADYIGLGNFFAMNEVDRTNHLEDLFNSGPFKQAHIKNALMGLNQRHENDWVYDFPNYPGDFPNYTGYIQYITPTLISDPQKGIYGSKLFWFSTDNYTVEDNTRLAYNPFSQWVLKTPSDAVDDRVEVDVTLEFVNTANLKLEAKVIEKGSGYNQGEIVCWSSRSQMVPTIGVGTFWFQVDADGELTEMKNVQADEHAGIFGGPYSDSFINQQGTYIVYGDDAQKGVESINTLTYYSNSNGKGMKVELKITVEDFFSGSGIGFRAKVDYIVEMTNNYYLFEFQNFAGEWKFPLTRSWLRTVEQKALPAGDLTLVEEIFDSLAEKNQISNYGFKMLPDIPYLSFQKFLDQKTTWLSDYFRRLFKKEKEFDHAFELEDIDTVDFEEERTVIAESLSKNIWQALYERRAEIMKQLYDFEPEGDFLKDKWKVSSEWKRKMFRGSAFSNPVKFANQHLFGSNPEKSHESWNNPEQATLNYTSDDWPKRYGGVFFGFMNGLTIGGSPVSVENRPNTKFFVRFAVDPLLAAGLDTLTIAEGGLEEGKN